MSTNEPQNEYDRGYREQMARLGLQARGSVGHRDYNDGAAAAINDYVKYYESVGDGPRTWSIVLAATVEAEDREEAECMMLALAPFETRDDVNAVMTRGTVHDDGGSLAERLGVQGPTVYVDGEAVGNATGKSKERGEKRD